MFKYRQNYKLVRLIKFPINLFTKKVDMPRHMKVLNLPRSKILSKDEIRAEYLKLAKQYHPDTQESKISNDSNKSMEFNDIKNSYDEIIDNYDIYCQYAEEVIDNIKEDPIRSKKIRQSAYLNHLRQNQRYEQYSENEDVYRPKEKFKINVSYFARYKWFAVILSKQMRRIYPDTWENLIALGVLVICVFLFIWRAYGFKVLYFSMKPFNLKPLITKKIVEEKNLTIEDLNFIYENSDEYELDPLILKEVESYRKMNKMSLNKYYSGVNK